MRIVFCGTPEFGVRPLRRLISDPAFTVEAVITQPDRPRGRGHAVSASPIKQVAAETGIPVLQPEKVRADTFYDEFKRLAPDAVVIIAFGQIIPQRLIEIPRLGWINLHASLLPKYRGAAPIAWAIANGERTTGITTIRIDVGMDTGPVILQHAIEIGADETAPELVRRMSEAGAPLMVDTLRQLEAGEIRPQPQDVSQASYARLLNKDDGRIDWSRTAQEIYNRMRGFAPWPGAFTTFRGHTCQIWGRPAEPANVPHGLSGDIPGAIFASEHAIYVGCGRHTFMNLEGVQMEGRKRIAAREFANGAHLKTGEEFGT